MTLEELVEKVEGYNQVSGFMLPSGELALVLSHSATMDDIVLVRVREDVDVLDPQNESVAFGVVNMGGDWKDAHERRTKI